MSRSGWRVGAGARGTGGSSDEAAGSPRPRPACDTPHVATMRELADRLENAAASVVDLAPAIEAGEPWPLTEVYGPGPESAWGPREVLAHVSEMLPFWLGEIELI